MSDSTILHDGEDFVLHHHQAGASYIIVSFIGSQQEGSAGHDFLLSSFARRYQISCLGITCKTRNLYTSGEMDQVILAATPILRRYQTVVVIGNSIGGYAAIKFSRRLGATHVLAVTPAYSLDADELRFDNDMQRSALEQDIPPGIASREIVRGMAIRPQDVSGRIVVVHNPHSPIDVHQMQHLRAAIALEGMPLQHEGHNLFSSLARPETMSKIVEALRFSSPAVLLREFRTIRRSIPDCIVPTLKHAMRRHPLLVDRALRSDAIAGSLARYGLDHGPLSNELAFRMAQRGYGTLARGRIERMIQDKLGKTARLSVGQEPGGTAALQPGRHYLLLSAHGSFLCTQGMRPGLTMSWNPFSDHDQAPVFASSSDAGLVLRTMQQDGRTSAPLDVGSGQSELHWIERDGFVMLRSASGFLSAQPDDMIHYRSDDADPLSRFLAIAVDEPKGLIQLRRTGWLEASVQRMSDSANDAVKRNTTRARPAVSGWSRLLGIARAR